MRTVALQYHDVIDGPDFDVSGVPGGDANSYKLSRESFAAHVAAVSAAVPPYAPDRRDLLRRAGPAGPGHAAPVGPPILFTFDDGGVSAHSVIADLLEAHGWRGLFFVTTDWIGRRGFLDAGQLRELDARGHTIGAHSCSHPLRFARCTPAAMRQEWRGSAQGLAELLGHEVTVASVPGGYYSRAVAEAAAESGLRVLFTSEPVTRVEQVGDCRVVGRFTLRRWSSPATAAAIAAGSVAPRAVQWLSWNTKKLVKSLWGDAYLRARLVVLNGSES